MLISVVFTTQIRGKIYQILGQFQSMMMMQGKIGDGNQNLIYQK